MAEEVGCAHQDDSAGLCLGLIDSRTWSNFLTILLTAPQILIDLLYALSPDP